MSECLIPAGCDRDHVHALMRRFNEIGVLLPTPEELDTTDASAIASVKLLMREMMAIKAEIDALIAAATQ
jgi:hypothetical protein